MKNLINLLRKFNNRSGDADLLRWAQTEYGNDWQYAYRQMKQTGKAPLIGVKN